MRAVKFKETYKEWFKTAIMFTLRVVILKSVSIEYVNDVYRGFSANTCTRDERGKSKTRKHLQKCYKPENKRKCIEPERDRISDDLMELNDTALNHIYFEMDSDDI